MIKHYNMDNNSDFIILSEIEPEYDYVQEETIIAKSRFVDKEPCYYNNYTPNNYTPYTYTTPLPENGVHTYSFALYPENCKPSGTINYSMPFKYTELKLSFDEPKIKKGGLQPESYKACGTWNVS